MLCRLALAQRLYRVGNLGYIVAGQKAVYFFSHLLFIVFQVNKDAYICTKSICKSNVYFLKNGVNQAEFICLLRNDFGVRIICSNFIH